MAERHPSEFYRAVANGATADGFYFDRDDVDDLAAVDSQGRTALFLALELREYGALAAVLDHLGLVKGTSCLAHSAIGALRARDGEGKTTSYTRRPRTYSKP